MNHSLVEHTSLDFPEAGGGAQASTFKHIVRTKIVTVAGNMQLCMSTQFWPVEYTNLYQQMGNM